ncbi:MAG: hypothetical protein FJZ58_05405 [Chlamydiae bacterium]|nr:hypothetical protein [Chlamydiota bacterium]
MVASVGLFATSAMGVCKEQMTKGPLAEKIAQLIKDHAFIDAEYASWVPTSLFPGIRVLHLISAGCFLGEEGFLRELVTRTQIAAMALEALGALFLKSSPLCILSIVLDMVRGVVSLFIVLEEGDGVQVAGELFHLISHGLLLFAVTYGSLPFLAMALYAKALGTSMDALFLGTKGDEVSLMYGFACVYLYWCFGEMIPHARALQACGEFTFTDTIWELLQAYPSLGVCR